MKWRSGRVVTPRVLGVLLASALACSMPARADGQLPNNFPILNEAGTAATFSTAGFVDLNNPFHVPQGTNGRSCESCHLVQTGWSVRPVDVELRFWLTQGRPHLQPARREQPDGGRLDGPGALRVVQHAAQGPVPARRHGAGERGVRDHRGRRSARRRRQPHALRGLPAAAGDGQLPHREERRLARPEHERQRRRPRRPRQPGHRQHHRRPAGRAGRRRRPSRRSSSTRRASPSPSSSCSASGCSRRAARRAGRRTFPPRQPVNARFDLFDAWIDLAPGSCTTRVGGQEARADRARAGALQQPERGRRQLPRLPQRRQQRQQRERHAVRRGRVARRSSASRACRSTRCATRRRWTNGRRPTRAARCARALGGHGSLQDAVAARPRRACAVLPQRHRGDAQDVVVHYEVALGFVFTPQEREDLVAFLEAL